MRSIFLELNSDCRVCMRPTAFAGIRSLFLSNIDARAGQTIRKEEKTQAFAKFTNGQLSPMTGNTAAFMGSAQIIKEQEDLTSEDQIINIVRLTGPMTRSGDLCSYGSKDIRNMLIGSANIEQTVGHIIYCNTPGGMASTLRDFRQAINYCHSKGQKVYMYCDGDVASGGAFVAAMCDGVWANNPEDEIGSLGMYSSFFTLADGAKNAITSETYREYYASASTGKNKWYRDAAADDMSTVEEETERDLAQLLANLKQDRPAIKDEQMNGDMFPMGEVVGSLIDGFCSLPELVQTILDDYTARKGASLPPKEVADAVPAASKANSNIQNTETKMKTYTHVGAFIGEGPMESDKEGLLTLQPYQADAVEEKLANVETEKQNLADEVTSLKQEKETMTAEVDELNKHINELTTAMETLTSEKTALDTKIQELTESLQTVTSEKDQLVGDMAVKDQTITDLQTTVEELNATAGATPNAGESPKNNGASGQVPKLKAGYNYDPSLTPGENRIRKEAHLKKLKAQVYGE